MKSNFQVIREIACMVGVSSPESDEEIYSITFLNSIKRSIVRVFNEVKQANTRISELENSDAFTRYKTSAAESLAGIAIRQLGDQLLWVEVARLNSLEHPDMHPNDYYPVGTVLILPNLPRAT